jgi:hypothetical protein
MRSASRLTRAGTTDRMLFVNAYNPDDSSGPPFRLAEWPTLDLHYGAREDLSSRDAAMWASALSDVFPSKGGASEHATLQAGLG